MAGETPPPCPEFVASKCYLMYLFFCLLRMCFMFVFRHVIVILPPANVFHVNSCHTIMVRANRCFM